MNTSSTSEIIFRPHPLKLRKNINLTCNSHRPVLTVIDFFLLNIYRYLHILRIDVESEILRSLVSASFCVEKNRGE